MDSRLRTPELTTLLERPLLVGLVSLDPAKDRGIPDGLLLALANDIGPLLREDGDEDLDVGCDCDTPGLDLDRPTLRSGLGGTPLEATGDLLALGKLAVGGILLRLMCE